LAILTGNDKKNIENDIKEVKEVKEKNNNKCIGIIVGRTLILMIKFADDIVVITEEENYLQRAHIEMQSTIKKYKMNIYNNKIYNLLLTNLSVLEISQFVLTFI